MTLGGFKHLAQVTVDWPQDFFASPSTITWETVMLFMFYIGLFMVVAGVFFVLPRLVRMGIFWCIPAPAWFFLKYVAITKPTLFAPWKWMNSFLVICVLFLLGVLWGMRTYRILTRD